MLMLKDASLYEIIGFLDAADQHGHNIPTRIGPQVSVVLLFRCIKSIEAVGNEAIDKVLIMSRLFVIVSEFSNTHIISLRNA